MDPSEDDCDKNIMRWPELDPVDIKLENCRDLKKILPGFYEKLPDTDEIPELPQWANIEMVKKGQQFGLKYQYGLNYSQTLSLMYLFASPDGLKPLIFTGKSHTPYLAHRRYLSTALRVRSWYETEFWDGSSPGYKNLKTVRSLHLDVSKRLSGLAADEMERRCDLEGKLRDCGFSLMCPSRHILEADFSNHAANMSLPDMNLDSVTSRLYFNQLEMSMTQFGFFGLMLIYPEKFAAEYATEEELECFVHMWKLLGYLLGIKDEYNFCTGDLKTVKLRSRQFVESMVKPHILRVHDNKEWEHMIRCAFRGIEKFTKLKINFESTLLYFCWILNIPTPLLVQSMGWKGLIRFYLTKFIMTKAHLIPGFAKFFNYRITRNIEQARIDFENANIQS